MRAAFISLSLSALMGCQKLGEVGKALEAYRPTVRFERLDLKEIDFQHVKTDLVFAVDNPNPVRLSLSSFSYRLMLEGQEALSGDRERGFAMEASGSSELPLPLSLAFADIPALLENTRGKDELGFSVAGEMGIETPVGELKLPYNASGRMPVLRPPKVRFSKLRVKELALKENRASLALDLNVSNQGNATIALKNVGYRLSLNDRQVARGEVAGLGEVGGESQKIVTVPIDLSLLEVGGTLIDLLSSRGEVSAKWAADLTVATPFGDIPLSINESGRLDIE